MKLKWLAHAAFLITSDDGTRIITDPYKTAEGFQHGQINEPADIVTVSHEHADHNNTAVVKGNPHIVRGTAEVKGISFKAIPTAHDAKGGSERGKNNIYCFRVEGIRVCHLGDLGHPLTASQITEVGEVNILLIPVGGFFTIDAGTAGMVAEQLGARVIIPMHYKTDKMNWPISGVEGFLKGKENVTRLDTSEVAFTSAGLPSSPQIMVLKPSL